MRVIQWFAEFRKENADSGKVKVAEVDVAARNGAQPSPTANAADISASGRHYGLGRQGRRQTSGYRIPSHHPCRLVADYCPKRLRTQHFDISTVGEKLLTEIESRAEI